MIYSIFTSLQNVKYYNFLVDLQACTKKVVETTVLKIIFLGGGWFQDLNFNLAAIKFVECMMLYKMLTTPTLVLLIDEKKMSLEKSMLNDK